ncbi:MAG TPA: hypothetical protein VHH36_00905 [Candidatus Thermoplasmatota archaeon]|nr:hypothetical protein [Candidatus Thermoplasmatota archaeon]
MQDKLEQLRRLVLSGYVVVGVDSDDACVRATLSRSGQVVVVRLHRDDAKRLLYLDPLRGLR